MSRGLRGRDVTGSRRERAEVLAGVCLLPGDNHWRAAADVREARPWDSRRTNQWPVVAVVPGMRLPRGKAKPNELKPRLALRSTQRIPRLGKPRFTRTRRIGIGWSNFSLSETKGGGRALDGRSSKTLGFCVAAIARRYPANSQWLTRVRGIKVPLYLYPRQHS